MSKVTTLLDHLLRKGTRWFARLVALAAVAGVCLLSPASAKPHAVPAVDSTGQSDAAVDSTGQSDAAVNESLSLMARLFARAVTDENLRRQIHDGVAKRFDGDTNILFSTLSNTSGIRAALAKRYGQWQGVERGAALRDVDRVASDIPRFQVAVPARFAAWDPATFTPLVGYMPEGVEDTALKTITAYDAEGRAHQLDAQVAPEQPVIILGVSERTDNSGRLLENQSTTAYEQPSISGPHAVSASTYVVTLNAAAVRNAHEPWTKGAAEISFRAKSRGCVGVNHTDHNVTGLDYVDDYRTWWGGLTLGRTKCPVIFYWWEDDGGAFDFTLSYGKFSLGVKMDDADDLIGGHQHALRYFKGGSAEWYYGLDDIDYNTK